MARSSGVNQVALMTRRVLSLYWEMGRLSLAGRRCSLIWPRGKSLGSNVRLFRLMEIKAWVHTLTLIPILNFMFKSILVGKFLTMTNFTKMKIKLNFPNPTIYSFLTTQSIYSLDLTVWIKLKQKYKHYWQIWARIMINQTTLLQSASNPHIVVHSKMKLYIG